jgi:NADPH:quinone reductase-like Zn-dependent oxidoreductase
LLSYRLTAFQALSPHVSAATSVLVIGSSGGTGHIALQIARCLGAKQITGICSNRNIDFCRTCGAAEVIDYSKGTKAMLDDLLQSPHKPFHIVMDCVSSADPRDMIMDYPNLLQDPTNAKQLLTDDFIYRRLGGPSVDWIRAGLEHTTGIKFWPNCHDKLFWIRLPRSANELQIIKEWVEEGKVLPKVAAAYDFSETGISKAFDDLISRRIQGKCIVKIDISQS